MMQKKLLLLACILACAGLLPLPARSDGAGSTATPPPQIYHTVTTALCARLHEHIRPAVAMILENDTKIAKSPPLFKRYKVGTLTASDQTGAAGTTSNGDSIYTQSPETAMALQQMAYLVLPIARNLIAAQTLLDDVKLVAPTGNPTDDAAIARIKAQLLQTIAYQSASLDLINGFVQTQQMGDLQHVGTEYLGSIGGNETDQPDDQADAEPLAGSQHAGHLAESLRFGPGYDSWARRRLQPAQSHHGRHDLASDPDRSKRGRGR